MRKTFCDRCGKFVDESILYGFNPKIRNIEYDVHDEHSAINSRRTEKIEICHDCYLEYSAAVERFMAGDPVFQKNRTQKDLCKDLEHEKLEEILKAKINITEEATVLEKKLNEPIEVDISYMGPTCFRITWGSSIGWGTFDIFRNVNEWRLDNETMPRSFVKQCFNILIDKLPLEDPE